MLKLLARPVFCFVILLLAALTLHAQETAQGNPKTPAEKVYLAWLTAFNSADPAQFQAFDKKYQPSRPMAGDAEFQKMTGGFTLLQVESNTATQFIALVREKNSDNVGRLTLTVSTDDPPKILSMEIRLVSPQAGGPDSGPGQQDP
jgi:D-alanyl-D-alanine carboxypeptidase